MKRSPRRNFFRHKSYSFLSREVRLMILLFYKIGVQWGYKSHPHSLKALILSLFSQKYGFWANYSILLQVYSYNSIRKCSCSARFTCSKLPRSGHWMETTNPFSGRIVVICPNAPSAR